MSDGGRENRKEHGIPNAHRKSGAGEFVRAIARISVAQVCESEGFQTFQHSAIEAFSDVAVRFIHHVGKTALLYANLAGRTEVSALDIIQGLEDLSSVVGFAGASSIDHCLAHSGVLGEISHYVNDTEEVPFGYALPQFPVHRDRRQTPSFLQAGQEPPHEHIPAWLPPFPDTQDHVQLPTQDGTSVDPHVVTDENAKDNEKPERSLSNVNRGLSVDALEVPALADSKDAAKLKGAVINPYLAAPLSFGEKEVSPILPAKLSSEAIVDNCVVQNELLDNRVSVLETFAPAIEGMKSRLHDSVVDEGQKKVLLGQRSPVQFKIRISKKPLNAKLAFSLQNKDVQEVFPESGNCNFDDCQRGRALKVLRESMDDTVNLA